MLTQADRNLLEATAELTYCNPFLPERVELEAQALGPDFEPHGEVWHSSEASAANPNILRIQEKLEKGLPLWRTELLEQSAPTREDLQLYRDVVYYTMYNRWEEGLLGLLLDSNGSRRVALWPEFEAEHGFFLPAALQLPDQASAELVLAWFFQLRRAFHYVFHSLYGSSLPVARLRAQIWPSISSNFSIDHA